MPGSVQKVQRLIDDAVAKGATVLAGGKPGPANSHPQQAAAAAAAPAVAAAHENGGAVPPPSPARVTRRAAAAAAAAGGSSDGGSSSSSSVGQFYPPTIITGVTKEMDLYYEEAFGPVSCRVLGFLELLGLQTLSLLLWHLAASHVSGCLLQLPQVSFLFLGLHLLARSLQHT
jgi:acyl-CoA reductase-like NAD-dependent aldehyde dehydrogenase